MTTIRRILLFFTRVIEAWNSVFGQKPAREEQEKQKEQAERDNREARESAAQKAGEDRKRGLREIQKKGGNDW